MTDHKHLYWHQTKITREQRSSLNGHKSFVIWFSGLSGSGKSSLANEVERMLYDKGFKTYILDGDNVRHGLNRDLGFGISERRENLRRIGETAKLFIDAGVIVLAAFISPYHEDRQMVYSLFDKQEVIEVYVKCSLEECERRDVKGLYTKARKGEIRDFTGISSPYEEPVNPDCVVETEVLSKEESAKQIIDFLIESGKIEK
ncbi:adenylyl-sulfate kinase [Paenibacillus whitsoniae]|uniref:Adenylyl-sulfate kinase n=1 Tax=Paenibacillus whitsoniae TaxID=2496558 RepID=A0A3S0A2D9_9BACL|nr:adenylyl-sulfate kinase [Paenibacillus whitsoniae]RTE07974.1 adenylyl-sulfate kinase [Paenibacillus whitsoniae]